MKFRQRKEKYLPPQYNGNKGLLSLFSPYMTCDDLKWMLRFDQLIASNDELYEALFSKEKLSMYNYNLRYEVPVIMIAGSLDWTTPHCMAAKYFYDITSPQKEFITIDNAGHIPFVEKPKEVSMAILKALSNVEKPYC